MAQQRAKQVVATPQQAAEVGQPIGSTVATPSYVIATGGTAPTASEVMAQNPATKGAPLGYEWAPQTPTPAPAPAAFVPPKAIVPVGALVPQVSLPQYKGAYTSQPNPGTQLYNTLTIGQANLQAESEIMGQAAARTKNPLQSLGLRAESDVLAGLSQLPAFSKGAIYGAWAGTSPDVIGASIGTVTGSKSAASQWSYLEKNPGYFLGDIGGQIVTGVVAGYAISGAVGTAGKGLVAVREADVPVLSNISGGLLKGGEYAGRAVSAPFSYAGGKISEATGVDIGQSRAVQGLQWFMGYKAPTATTIESVEQGAIYKTDITGGVGQTTEDFVFGKTPVSKGVAKGLETELSGFKPVSIEATGMQSVVTNTGDIVTSDISKVTVSRDITDIWGSMGKGPLDFGATRVPIAIPAGETTASDVQAAIVDRLMGTETLDTKAFFRLEPPGEAAVEKIGYMVEPTEFEAWATAKTVEGGEVSTRMWTEAPGPQRMTVERELPNITLFGEKTLPENPLKAFDIGQNFYHEGPPTPFDFSPPEEAKAPSFPNLPAPAKGTIEESVGKEDYLKSLTQFPKIGGKSVIAVSEGVNVDYLRYPGEGLSLGVVRQGETKATQELQGGLNLGKGIRRVVTPTTMITPTTRTKQPTVGQIPIPTLGQPWWPGITTTPTPPPPKTMPIPPIQLQQYRTADWLVASPVETGLRGGRRPCRPSCLSLRPRGHRAGGDARPSATANSMPR